MLAIHYTEVMLVNVGIIPIERNETVCPGFLVFLATVFRHQGSLFAQNVEFLISLMKTETKGTALDYFSNLSDCL